MSARWTMDGVKRLGIELSNYCNSACPGCPRFYHNSPLLAPGMVLDQITFDQFSRWFPKDFLSHINYVLLCGANGDPATATDLLEICRHMLDSNPHMVIQINTNGGTRNQEFWKNLGELFSGTNCHVNFSIDGLEDTNHLYRRNVVWERVMENTQAYITAGGTAGWHYLVFKHNEHQLTDANQFSVERGFKNFWVKKAMGFEDNGRPWRMPVLNSQGVTERWIDPPDNKAYRNLSDPITEEVYEPILDFDPNSYGMDMVMKDRRGELDGNVDTRTINCKSLVDGNGEIYVDCHGMVYPCPWIAARLGDVASDPRYQQLCDIMEVNKHRFDLKRNSLQEMFDSRCLDEIFAASWSKPSCKDGKLMECLMTCSSSNRGIDNIFDVSF